MTSLQHYVKSSLIPPAMSIGTSCGACGMTYHPPKTGLRKQIIFYILQNVKEPLVPEQLQHLVDGDWELGKWTKWNRKLAANFCNTSNIWHPSTTLFPESPKTSYYLDWRTGIEWPERTPSWTVSVTHIPVQRVGSS